MVELEGAREGDWSRLGPTCSIGTGPSNKSPGASVPTLLCTSWEVDARARGETGQMDGFGADGKGNLKVNSGCTAGATSKGLGVCTDCEGELKRTFKDESTLIWSVMRHFLCGGSCTLSQSQNSAARQRLRVTLFLLTSDPCSASWVDELGMVSVLCREIPLDSATTSSSL